MLQEIGNESCSICLDDFSVGDAMRELTCSHVFHKACIDPWLLAHQNCPNCKTNILKALNLDKDLVLPSDSPPESHAGTSRGNHMALSRSVSNLTASTSASHTPINDTSIFTLPVTANFTNTSDRMIKQSVTVQTSSAFMISEDEAVGSAIEQACNSTMMETTPAFVPMITISTDIHISTPVVPVHVVQSMTETVSQVPPSGRYWNLNDHQAGDTGTDPDDENEFAVNEKIEKESIAIENESDQG